MLLGSDIATAKSLCELSETSRPLEVRLSNGRRSFLPLEPGDIGKCLRRTGRGAARGFGLGPAARRRMVTAHAGKICVENIPGPGSIFTIPTPTA